MAIVFVIDPPKTSPSVNRSRQHIAAGGQDMNAMNNGVKTKDTEDLDGRLRGSAEEPTVTCNAERSVDTTKYDDAEREDQYSDSI
jgi:hypothetical protein